LSRVYADRIGRSLYDQIEEALLLEVPVITKG